MGVNRAFSMIFKFYALQGLMNVSCLKIAANLDGGDIPAKVFGRKAKNLEFFT